MTWSLKAAGLVLFGTFGSLLPFLYADLREEERIHAALENADTVFVTIVAAQKRRTFSGERTYFSVEYSYRSNRFRQAVEVSPDVFHLQKPGKNLEAHVTLVRGRPWVRIASDPVRPPWSLFYVSLVLAGTGFVFLAAGFLWRRK
jgi:hypothetical protein